MKLRGRDVRRYGLAGLLLLVLLVLLVYPIVLTVRGGFVSPEGHFTLRYLTGVFVDPVWMGGLVNSLLIAACTTVLALLIALPLALLSARCRFRGQALLSALVLVPLILPPFVGAIGMRAILGRAGAVNALLMRLGLLDSAGPGLDFLGGGWLESLLGPGAAEWGLDGRLLAVVVVEALHLYPILFLNLAAALANLDPALEEAAINLGAGRWHRFRRVTLPLILPGLFAGATIVFIWSFTELGTPLMFDYYQVTPVQVFWGVQEVAENPRPYALVVVMLAVALGLYLLGRGLLGGRGYAMQSRASIAAQPRLLTGWRGAAAAGAFLLVTLLAVLPHLGVVLSSFSVDGAWYRSLLPTHWTGGHYAEALSHPLAVDAIRNSLVYACLAMALCLGAGLAIAYLTVRCRIRGGWALDALAMLPLAVPGLVMAFGYVAVSLAWPFGKGQPLEGWLSVVGTQPNPVPLLVIAYAVRRLPYVVRSAAAGLEQTSGQLEEAALNLGASTFTTLRRVVVPLILANLIAGALLAFSFSMLEVSDSLLLAQKEVHYPITKAIFELYNRLGDGPYIASAMGVWAMALLTVTLVAAALLMGKKMGAIFRV